MDQWDQGGAEPLRGLLLLHDRFAGVDIDDWIAWLTTVGVSTTVHHLHAVAAPADRLAPDIGIPDVIIATDSVSDTALRELAAQLPGQPLALRLPPGHSPPWQLLRPTQGETGGSFPHMTLLAAGLELVSR